MIHNVLDTHVYLVHIREMKLAAYMKITRTTDAKLAEEVERDRSTVTRWRQGKTRPDWLAIEKLEAVTNGAVTAQDFVTLEAAR